MQVTSFKVAPGDEFSMNRANSESIAPSNRIRSDVPWQPENRTGIGLLQRHLHASHEDAGTSEHRESLLDKPFVVQSGARFIADSSLSVPMNPLVYEQKEESRAVKNRNDLIESQGLP